MKLIIQMLLLTTLIFSNTLLAKDAEFQVLPIFLDDDWDSEAEVSAVLGSINFDENFKSGANYGVDLSFNCPVFTLPGEHILRQRLTLSRYNKQNLTITTIEMNPYYLFKLSKDLQFGFGPGISGHYTDIQGLRNKWIFGWQAGAGIKYFLNDTTVIGLDIRRQWTKRANLGNVTEDNLNQYKHIVKIGYRF